MHLPNTLPNLLLVLDSTLDAPLSFLLRSSAFSLGLEPAASPETARRLSAPVATLCSRGEGRVLPIGEEVERIPPGDGGGNSAGERGAPNSFVSGEGEVWLARRVAWYAAALAGVIVAS